MAEIDAAEIDPGPAARPSDEAAETHRKAMRIWLAVSGVFVLGMTLAWPMAAIGAIFAGLLVQGRRPLPMKQGIGAILIAIIAMVANWYVSQFLLTYPTLFAIGVSVAMYALFRSAARGAPPAIVILITLALLLQPVLIRMSSDLAALAATWLPANLAIGVFASWVVFTLIPPRLDAPAKVKPGIVLDADRQASRMTLVAVPFALVFFSLNWGAVITLIFVALLTQQLCASTEAAGKASKGLLLANVAGGVVAMLAFEFLVMAPFYPFMVVLCLTLIGVFSAAMTSGAAWAPLAGTAMNAMLVLLGGAMAPLDDSVASSLGDRLVQIAMAVAYILIAFNIVDTYLPKRPLSHSETGDDPARPTE
ncbi:MAG: hypothetical protein AAF503_11570 [Pseudomonadota bacterium]